MINFQDNFETSKRSFISAFSNLRYYGKAKHELRVTSSIHELRVQIYGLEY